MARGKTSASTARVTLHRATGQARLRVNGRDYYLGKFGSPEAKQREFELRVELAAKEKPSGSTRTLTAVLAAWWPECQKIYGARGKGKHGNAGNWRPIIKILRENLGDRDPSAIEAHEFGDLLERVAAERSWTRTSTLANLNRIRTIYDWAAYRKMVTDTAAALMMRVKVPKYVGRPSSFSGPVSDEVVTTTLPFLSPTVAAMVQLQRLTGARPGEVCIMRPRDVDRKSHPDVWIYRPARHKNDTKGKSRSIYLGPKAQAILAPFLLRPEDAYCFSPRESEARRLRLAHEQRVTPLSCGNRPGSNRRSSPIIKPGESFRVDSYAQAIRRGCRKAFPAPEGLTDDDVKQWHREHAWGPHRLRKAAAAEARAKLDIEASAALLGHSDSIVTGRHYAGLVEERAVKAALALG